jgi:hypothetical protein
LGGRRKVCGVSGATVAGVQNEQSTPEFVMEFCEYEFETRCPSDATIDVVRLNLALNHNVEAIMLNGNEVNCLPQ